MLEQCLREKDYLSILKMNDGSKVTLENWSEQRRRNHFLSREDWRHYLQFLDEKRRETFADVC